MNNELPVAINKYKQAIVDNNTVLFDECFAKDAVVVDAGKTYTGIRAIKEWGDELSKMNLSTDITDVAADDTTATILTHVSGDFERSPLSFRYSMTLKDGKISTLDIKVV
jgi:hypothetical protein